jgi:hypothetical protein
MIREVAMQLKGKMSRRLAVALGFLAWGQQSSFAFTNPLAVITVIPICHPGGQFYAFLNNGAVTNVAVIPGL